MIIYNSSTYNVTPWKNGKGTTIELFRYPVDSTIIDFDLRISIADLNEDATFSDFKTYKRFISVLEGSYMLLSHNGSAFEKVNQFEIHSFNGDDVTTCKLEGQTLKDFNVIVSDKLSKQCSVYYNPKHLIVKEDYVYFLYVVKGYIPSELAENILANTLLRLKPQTYLELIKIHMDYYLIEIKI